MRWGEYYRTIRKVNIFIANIDVVPYKATYVDSRGEIRTLNSTLKAEARFLRAFAYFELVKRYGGVPLVGDQIFEIGDNLKVPRNTFADCIQYIVDELDDIKVDLRSKSFPESTNTYAYAPTYEACIALKSRVLLYAASPLFNERPIEAGNELVGYASYDPERWNLAAQAAREFIENFGPTADGGDGSYGLTPDFRDVFLNLYNVSTNPEIILYRIGSENDKSIETNNGPLGFANNSLGNGRTLPTQDLVDAFPMLDGKPAGESSSYPWDSNSETQYANRDPRLNYTILHHGSQWLNTTLDTSLGGTNNPTNVSEYSTTSYYMRKFMGKFETSAEYSGVNHHWVYIRYAEMLLNYAEAQNEYSGPNANVYKAIRDLRARAGIEPGADNTYGVDNDLSQVEMRDLIRNERRIEMAFEEQRYWDIRRWRLAEVVMNQPLQGMEITNSNGNYTFERVDVLTPAFATRQYLYPISYDEVVKNENMVQNPNW